MNESIVMDRRKIISTEFFEYKLEKWKQKFRDNIIKRKDKRNYSDMKISFYDDKLLDLYFYEGVYVFCFSSGKKKTVRVYQTDEFNYEICISDYSKQFIDTNTLLYHIQRRCCLVTLNCTVCEEKYYNISFTIRIKFYKTLHVECRNFIFFDMCPETFFENKIKKRKQKWNNY